MIVRFYAIIVKSVGCKALESKSGKPAIFWRETCYNRSRIKSTLNVGGMALEPYEMTE